MPRGGSHPAAMRHPITVPSRSAAATAARMPLAAVMCAAAKPIWAYYMMLDLERIGGVTGWQQAAALAAAAGIDISSHLFPEVSAHVLAAAPTAHWLEYVDWAAPILAAPLQIVSSCARAADVPGTGVV